VQCAPLEQEVSQAFGAAPRVVSKSRADSLLEKPLAPRPLHVLGAATGTLERLARFLRHALLLFFFLRQISAP
jgi:hypothetical protein